MNDVVGTYSKTGHCVSTVRMLSGQGSEHQRDASAHHVGCNTANMNMCFCMFSAQRICVE